MKRKVLALVLIAIVSYSLALWFIHDQIVNMQKPTYKVEITNLTAENWEYPGGLLSVRNFNVEIKNNGTNAVGGVTLAYKIIGNQTYLLYNLRWVDPEQMGVLHEGESKKIVIMLETMLEYIPKFSGCSFVATLMLDEVVLDERILTL